MEIFLIRHAHAVDLEPDAARPLSARGRRQVAAMGRYLRRHGLVGPVACWHSPLVRAVETARRLAPALRFTALRATNGLLPEDDPSAMARKLRVVRRPVAVVGHEPQLSALASLLLAGAPAPALLRLRKGAVAALERDGRSFRLLWLADPEMIG